MQQPQNKTIKSDGLKKELHISKYIREWLSELCRGEDIPSIKSVEVILKEKLDRLNHYTVRTLLHQKTYSQE